MNTPDETQRLRQIARQAMRAWAKMWCVIRRDRQEAARAVYYLKQAIIMREKSKTL